MTEPMTDGEFELYDLRVEVVGPADGKIYCGANLGDYFDLQGEMLILPPGQGFSLYSLAALLPLLPAKQRVTDPNDWMSTDTEVACPDPHCQARFRITRTRVRRFHRADVTAVPLMPRSKLSDGFSVSRIIKGGWHLAGGHGAIDPAQAQRDMAAFVEAGITTFDCANIYTGVEQLIGDFRRNYPDHAQRLQIFTKFVPDLLDLATLDRHAVELAIERSLTRLGVEQLDAVQFHWWDYSTPRYVEIALELDRLRRAGKIARVAVTNFDVSHLSAIVDAGVRISSHQLQYSLLDTRPERQMVDYCLAHDIALLCYGTVAGGFLSERWLQQPEPTEPFANRSLVKYKLVIDDFGGWARFQALLAVLRQIAVKHNSDIATLATRAILDRPGVCAAIVGATNTAYLAAHLTIGSLRLDEADRTLLADTLTPCSGPLGDVYSLERERTGRHGRIMRYELTKAG